MASVLALADESNIAMYVILGSILIILVAILLVLLFRHPLHKARAQDANVGELQAQDQGVRNTLARDIDGARDLLMRAQNSAQSSGLADQAVAIRKASDALDQLRRQAQQAEAGRVDPLKIKQLGIEKIEKLKAFDRTIGDMVKGLFSKAEHVQSSVTNKKVDELSGDLTVLVEQTAEILRRFREREQIVQS